MKGYDLVKPWLFRMDAERVHEQAMALLHRFSRSPQACAGLRQYYHYDDPRLMVRAFGRTVSNPLGIAAGLDKNAEAVPALQALGFGFVEVGTVTPRPQPGNPRPRIFRLQADKALINRMGFPGQGMAAVERNLSLFADRLGMLGLNIGPNRDSVEPGTAHDDCVAVLEQLHHFADYLVVNVSSPNTAKLRSLQGREALQRLLSRVLEVAERQDVFKPILVKIAPDLTDQELYDILQVATGLNLGGIVATNTTVTRPVLRSGNWSQTGGLSGAPLRDKAVQVVGRIYRETDGRLPIIAAGGVFDAYDVLRYVAAGATLAQTYTGFVYQGPSMARDIKRSLSELLDHFGFDSIMQVRGHTELF